MTIIEALASANWLGRPVICRTIRDGFTMAVRFENRSCPMRAIYREDSLLSSVTPWEPRKGDILAVDWDLFDPTRFALPVPAEELLPGPEPAEAAGLRQLMERPVSSPEFRTALTEVTDAEIYTAADRLEDQRKTGAKCKTRLEAISKEIVRREKGRGQNER